MFDEAIHMGYDYISDTVVVRGTEGWGAFCAITRLATHTKAAGWEDHNA